MSSLQLRKFNSGHTLKTSHSLAWPAHPPSVSVAYRAHAANGRFDGPQREILEPVEGLAWAVKRQLGRWRECD